MARSTSAAGHNSTLADDDAVALQLHHSLAIRRLQAAADAAKAIYDEKRQDVNQAFALLKGDLGIKRKEMEEVHALQDMSESEFIAAELRRHALMANQGLPVGHQLDMFEGKDDTVTDQHKAYLDGRRAGRRGDFGVPPETLSPMFIPDWMRGWSEIQEENAPRLLRAAEILEERRIASNGDMEGEDDDSDRDGEDADDEAHLSESPDTLRERVFGDAPEPKAAESFDPLVVDGVRYSTPRLAKEARGRAERAAADARQFADAE